MVPLGPEHVQQAFDLATRTFVEGSSLHLALGVTLARYRAYLFPSFVAMVEEGRSVVAIEGRSGDVAGCLIATDFFPHLTSGTGINAEFAPIATLTRSLRQRYLSHRKIRAGEAILVDMGAVSPRFANKGVYQQLRENAQACARQSGFQFVVGELSSQSTQHVILNKFGHEKVAEIAFSGFEFEGSWPFEGIRDPKSIILSEGRL